MISGAPPSEDEEEEEEEEEEEVEVDHDDYDPVLASTPSSAKNTKSFLDDLLEDQVELSVDDKLDVIVQNQKALFKLFSEFIKERRETVVCCCQTGIRHGVRKDSGIISNNSVRASVGGDTSSRRVNIGGETSPGREGRDMSEGISYVITGDISEGFSTCDVSSKVSGGDVSRRDISEGFSTCDVSSEVSGGDVSRRDISEGFSTCDVSSEVSGGDVIRRDMSEGSNVAREVSGEDAIRRDISEGLSTCNFSSILSGGDVSDLGDYEEGDNFLRQALKLKSQSCSLGNFAQKLVKVFFQPEELVNRNCTGTREKGQLDPNKLGMVRGYVFKLFPCAKSLEDAQWRKCVVCIDEFLRKKKKLCGRQGGLKGLENKLRGRINGFSTHYILTNNFSIHVRYL